MVEAEQREQGGVQVVDVHAALDRLQAAGFAMVCGLEVEFHIYRIRDAGAQLDPLQADWPGPPPASLEMVHPGYSLLGEVWYDMAEEPLRIHFDPGSQFQYSGEGYSFLQLVVAHLTGRVSTEECETLFDGLTVCATDVDAYMKTNLLRPFGMTTSGYVWEPDSPAFAVAHDANGVPTGRSGMTPVLAARYGAAGNLSTSAVEYARFLSEVLDPKPSDDFRLSAASHAEMLRPQVKVDDTSSWALGWQVLHRENGDLLSHGGDN